MYSVCLVLSNSKSRMDVLPCTNSLAHKGSTARWTRSSPSSRAGESGPDHAGLAGLQDPHAPAAAHGTRRDHRLPDPPGSPAHALAHPDHGLRSAPPLRGRTTGGAVQFLAPYARVRRRTGGTVIRDHVRYLLPFGVLGRLVARGGRAAAAGGPSSPTGGG